ncbi:MAG: hypothetical protein RR335_10175 [Eubacterium sp.]
MFSRLIEHAIININVEKQEVANKIGISRNNFYRDLKRDDFKESRMREIAEALGCDLVIELKPKKEIATTKVDCES